ncbi:MAG: Gfo/Idh/MocA family oxidoreductase [Planctomycetes bacterium]|nr:Gfo/Idh/MocA family oxidoreductase [Planctomycetota bacterium]
MKPLGVGIIGLKHQHPRWYQPLWQYLPEYRLVAMSDEDERFAAGENELFKLDVHTDYHDLLKRDDVDVVIIWLPHSQMPSAVEAAAQAGKHVIVEKPCAANLAGVRRIAGVAQRHPHLKISSPYCWRNHAVSSHIKQLFGEGALGNVTAFNVRLNAGGAHRYVRDNALWMLNASEGGGPMWNLAVHWLDYVHWLTGEEFTAARAFFTPPAGPPRRDIEDSAQAVLKLSSGAIVSVDVSYSITPSYPGARDIYFSARGTNGSLAWSPAWTGTEDELLIVREDRPDGARGESRKITSEAVSGYGGQMGRDWLRRFATAVLEDRPPDVSVGDMLSAAKAADMAIASARAN